MNMGKSAIHADTGCPIHKHAIISNPNETSATKTAFAIALMGIMILGKYILVITDPYLFREVITSINDIENKFQIIIPLKAYKGYCTPGV